MNVFGQGSLGQVKFKIFHSLEKQVFLHFYTSNFHHDNTLIVNIFALESSLLLIRLVITRIDYSTARTTP